MAHTILGIDLGRWSVKVAELHAGFRQVRLGGLYERRLLEPAENESHAARAARTVRALMDEHKLEAEMYATSMGGKVTLRLLNLPFADPKKIEQVIGYELEGTVLDNIDELLVDYVTSGRSGDQTRVLTAATQQEPVRELIDALNGVHIEPRVIGAAALSYAALIGPVLPPRPDPVAFVDVGHEYTHVCIVAGDVVTFARSIPRGSSDVDAALESLYAVSAEEAARIKHEQAFIAQPGEAPASPQHAQLAACVREALRPLVREIRQTLAAARAGAAAPVSVLHLCGGGALLRGFARHLELELLLPVSPLALREDDSFLAPGGLRGGTLGALPAQALGLALAVAAPVPQVNLRKGALAYRTDYSYLRGKATSLAIGVVAILIFAGLNAWASLRGLKQEAEGLQTQLKKETVELFGEARLDGRAVSEELKTGPKGGAPPVPLLSAFDVLNEVSRSVPTKDKIRLDILELDIKPKKTFLKGTVERKQEVDDLAQALEQIECFEKIEKGKISTVTAPGGESREGPAKLEEFSLNIDTRCP